MKKFLMYIFLIVSTSSVCMAAIKIVGAENDGLDYLRNEIRKLEKQLEQKTEELNKCAKKNNNFKIAGITAVGLAGVGVVTNISLYSKIKDQKKLAENMKSKIKTANVQMDSFANDMEKWSKNLDNDKFVQELDIQLTDAEKQRLIEIHNDDSDIEKVSESDKILLEKVIRAMQKCQK